MHLAGGLGNQMFQYAFARANAIRLATELRVDLSHKSLQIHNGFELNEVFNIHAKIVSQQELKDVLGMLHNPIVKHVITKLRLNNRLFKHYIKEDNFHFISDMMHIRDNSFVTGYWQSEKYFIDVVRSIKNDFTFKLPLQSKNADFAMQIARVDAVSLHIRRGDYISNPKNVVTHGVCSIEYYQAAIIHIAKHIKTPHFFVFSDDIAWVKNNLKLDFPHEYVEHNQGKESYNDMRLMSLCKHNIIANSSFSWWGAWLNSNAEKTVIAPKQWFARKVDTSDLIPNNWLTL